MAGLMDFSSPNNGSGLLGSMQSAGVSESENIEDRRNQWIRGLLGRLAPVTLYSQDDWMQMLRHPLTPFNPPPELPIIPPTKLGTEAGYGDIKSPLQQQYDKLRDLLWLTGAGHDGSAAP